MSDELNRTELQSILRDLEKQNAFREAPRAKLVAALDGVEDVPNCPLDPHRIEMERHIQKNYRRLRTQLPGCDGRCTTFGCPNLIVTRCWLGIKDDIL